MLHLRCTKKLIDELHKAGHELADETAEIPALNEWYGNLFRLERRKCLLFTHASTLFSFTLFGLTRPDFIALGKTFNRNLRSVLIHEGMDENLAETISPSVETVRLLKTRSRSVLGSMNDFIFQVRVHVEVAGGLARCDIADLNYTLNHVPMGALAYARPEAAFKHFLNIQLFT